MTDNHIDRDLLVAKVLPVAQERYTAQSTFRPFGAAVGTNGDVLHVGSDLAEDAVTNAVLTDLVAVARANAENMRAVAVASVLHNTAGDTIRIVTDEREVGATTFYFAVTRQRLTKKVRIGDPVVTDAAPWVWADSAADTSASSEQAESSEQTGLSEEAREDLEAMIDDLVDFGAHQLGTTGELYPYGSARAIDGEIKLLAGSDGGVEDDHPSSQSILDALLEGVRRDSAELRAFGLVADVRVAGGDALRVSFEHRSGSAVTILMPYSRDAATKQITFSDTNTMSLATPQIWV